MKPRPITTIQITQPNTPFGASRSSTASHATRVPLVDAIRHGLADEVGGDGVAGEAVVLEELPLLVDVFFTGYSGVGIEVVAPAGELEAVVAHFFRERGEFFEGKIGPLAGEQGDGAWHG